MASTGSRRKPLTYAVVDGLAGRPSHSHVLRKLLDGEHLQATEDTEQADIIITHSAGCWLVPKTAAARLVIWIGVPLAENQGRAYRQANLQIYRHAGTRRLVPLFAGNLYYALRYFRRSLAIIRMAKHAEPIILPKAAYVFIANRYDPWPRSRRLDTFLKTKDWAFISLSGSHDDVWHHPERYAAIIDHYARLLA
ncbi:MAG TPA: hypothetical protein VHA37_00175 [Candidatus Saccharimonadales bacterium]|nr:hypothetical protein [Candidatus Saccharimonadales bacterium]